MSAIPVLGLVVWSAEMRFFAAVGIWLGIFIVIAILQGVILARDDNQKKRGAGDCQERGSKLVSSASPVWRFNASLVVFFFLSFLVVVLGSGFVYSTLGESAFSYELDAASTNAHAIDLYRLHGLAPTNDNTDLLLERMQLDTTLIHELSDNVLACPVSDECIAWKDSYLGVRYGADIQTCADWSKAPLREVLAKGEPQHYAPITEGVLFQYANWIRAGRGTRVDCENYRRSTWTLSFLDGGLNGEDVADVLGVHSSLTFWDYLYFSVTTIATAGYGDIKPKSTGCRVFVMLEILAGVVLLGLFISFAAGLFSTGEGNEAEGFQQAAPNRHGDESAGE